MPCYRCWCFIKRKKKVLEGNWLSAADKLILFCLCWVNYDGGSEWAGFGGSVRGIKGTSDIMRWPEWECCRCCCFFKRKKKKGGRGKWLAVVQCSPEREAVTLLRATSQSNSRDSVLNPAVTWIVWNHQALSSCNCHHPMRHQFSPVLFIDFIFRHYCNRSQYRFIVIPLSPCCEHSSEDLAAVNIVIISQYPIVPLWSNKYPASLC